MRADKIKCCTPHAASCKAKAVPKPPVAPVKKTVLSFNPAFVESLTRSVGNVGDGVDDDDDMAKRVVVVVIAAAVVEKEDDLCLCQES